MRNTDLMKIISYYGDKKQKLKAVEELSELSVALMHDVNKGGNNDHVFEELADVWVMMNHLMIIYNFDTDVLIKTANKKIERTLERIKRGC